MIEAATGNFLLRLFSIWKREVQGNRLHKKQKEKINIYFAQRPTN